VKRQLRSARNSLLIFLSRNCRIDFNWNIIVANHTCTRFARWLMYPMEFQCFNRQPTRWAITVKSIKPDILNGVFNFLKRYLRIRTRRTKPVSDLSHNSSHLLKRRLRFDRTALTYPGGCFGCSTPLTTTCLVFCTVIYLFW